MTSCNQFISETIEKYPKHVGWALGVLTSLAIHIPAVASSQEGSDIYIPLKIGCSILTAAGFGYLASSSFEGEIKQPELVEKYPKLSAWALAILTAVSIHLPAAGTQEHSQGYIIFKVICATFTILSLGYISLTEIGKHKNSKEFIDRHPKLTGWLVGFLFAMTAHLAEAADSSGSSSVYVLLKVFCSIFIFLTTGHLASTVIENSVSQYITDDLDAIQLEDTPSTLANSAELSSDSGRNPEGGEDDPHKDPLLKLNISV